MTLILWIHRMNKLAILLYAVFLTACSSPPKPPTVSGAQRQPVNDAATEQMLALRVELSQAQEKLKNQPTEPVVLVAPRAPVSQTISVYFPYNKASFQPTPEQAAQLFALLQGNVRHVWVRGRTDGNRPNVADERIALQRAIAAKNWLIEQGVSSLNVSVNYVSAGDYIADNLSEAGRAKNRRVDIEIFNHPEGNDV